MAENDAAAAFDAADAVVAKAARSGQPLKILMISARFAPFVGGTEIHTGLVAAELVKRGHEVTVATTDLGGQLARSEMIDGIKVVRVRAWPRWSDLYFAPGLKNIMDTVDWDLVHVQGYHTAVAPLALSAAQKRGIPTVLTFHSGGHSSVRNILRPIHARILGSWLRATDLLIGVSNFEADLFAKRLQLERDRIQVIPNGVSEFKPEPEHPDEDESESIVSVADDAEAAELPLRVVSGGPTILSLGRLVRYKGHHRVIRALPHLLEIDPTISLLILGRGPYRKQLERLVSRLGLQGHVTFDYVPGHERQRLNDIMSEASLAILLSDYESHGMAAHEALSAGLPVIVLDRTALSDLVSAGVAHAVPPRATDREVASIVLRTLNAELDNRSKRVASPELARMQQSWPVIVDHLENAYYRLLGRSISKASEQG